MANCQTHEDVPYIVRPSNSVNGGSIGWGCAVCNMLEVERLREEVGKYKVWATSCNEPPHCPTCKCCCQTGADTSSTEHEANCDGSSDTR